MKIEDFKKIVDKLIEAGNEAVININDVFALSKLSPLSGLYITNNIQVFDRFPESIIFYSGDSVIQFSRVIEIKPVRGYVQTYTIHCGSFDSEEIRVRVEFRPKKNNRNNI